MDVPSFSPQGIDYTIDVEKFDPASDRFVPTSQITGAQRNDFPYTLRNMAEGVYRVRVDGQTSIGRRTFVTSENSVITGEFGNWHCSSSVLVLSPPSLCT